MESSNLDHWSVPEKKLARKVFQAALQRELADILAEFKSKVAAINTPDELWPLQDYLNSAQRNIDQKYDYRYSQLIGIFAQLVFEKRIDLEDLQGLHEAKLDQMRLFLKLWNGRR